MTYYWPQALLAVHWTPPRQLPVPTEQGRSHEPFVVAIDPALLKNKTPTGFPVGVFFFGSLAMTYSHMGRPHTTIGDASFHF